MRELHTTTSIAPHRHWARTLGTIAEHRLGDDAVFRRDLSWGDRVMVSTRNSVYWLTWLGGNTFCVTGGWFDLNGRSPAVVDVHGCTYGGSAIRCDVVAARGLFLELGECIRTTRIRSVRLLPRD